MAISVVGSLFISLLCIRQVDIKIIIAYSSVRHIGLFLIGALSFNGLGWEGGIIIILSHGFCSSGLFYLANVFYELLYTRNLILLKGSILFFPVLRVFWFIFCVFNIGAPPSINLIREILILVSIIKFSFFFFVYYSIFNVF